MSNKRHRAKSGARAGQWVSCTAENCRNGGVHATTAELSYARSKFEVVTGIALESNREIPMAFLQKLNDSGELAARKAADIAANRSKTSGDLQDNDRYTRWIGNYGHDYLTSYGPHSDTTRKYRDRYVNALVSYGNGKLSHNNQEEISSSNLRGLAQFEVEKVKGFGAENIKKLAEHAYNAHYKREMNLPLSEEEQVSSDYLGEMKSLQDAYHAESEDRKVSGETIEGYPFESERRLFNLAQVVPEIKRVPVPISRKKIILSKLARVAGIEQ